MKCDEEIKKFFEKAKANGGKLNLKDMAVFSNERALKGAIICVKEHKAICKSERCEVQTYTIGVFFDGNFHRELTREEKEVFW